MWQKRTWAHGCKKKDKQRRNLSFLLILSCFSLAGCLLRWLAAPCCLSTTARDGPKSGWSILVKPLLSPTGKSWHTGRCGWRATERTVTSLDWTVCWTSFHPWWTVSLEGSEPSAEISLLFFWFYFGKEQHYLVSAWWNLSRTQCLRPEDVSVPPPPPTPPRTFKIPVRETQKGFNES